MILLNSSLINLADVSAIRLTTDQKKWDGKDYFYIEFLLKGQGYFSVEFKTREEAEDSFKDLTKKLK